MKFISLFLLFFLALAVDAQRRTTPRSEPDPVPSKPPLPRGRGRLRFAATQDFLETSEAVKSTTESSNKRVISSRKRVSETTSDRRIISSRTLPTESSIKNVYEVEEFVNESPIESFKRASKPRVLSESHFEASNSPRRNSLDVGQSKTDIPPALLKSTEQLSNNAIFSESLSQSSSSTQTLDATEELVDTTLKANLLDSSETSISDEYKGDFTKTASISTSPKPTEIKKSQNGVRRSGVRSRFDNNVTESPTTQSSRVRSRTRPTRKPEDNVVSTSIPSRNFQRGSRKRVEPSSPLFEPTRKGPSVFGAESVQFESRSRHGRRIDVSAPEKITVDLTGTRNWDRRRTVASTTTSKPTDDSRGRSSNRSQSKQTIPTPQSFSSRPQFRSRDFPLFIDEQKLEVLPLFENEPKTVPPVTRGRTRASTPKYIVESSTTSSTSSITPVHRRVHVVKKLKDPTNKTTRAPRERTRAEKRTEISTERLPTASRDSKRSRSNKLKDTFQTSATENNEVKFTKPNEVVPQVSVSISVETKTEPSAKPVVKKPQVKESIVVSQSITEVTSRRTVPRRKSNNENKIKVDKPKVTVSQVISRGKKKSEVKLTGIKKKKSDSSDEINDSDNYPEPFKALIQAKKQNKQESRSLLLPLVNPKPISISGNTNIVTSSSSSISQSIFTVPSTEASTREFEEDDNELEPKPSRITPRTTTILQSSTTSRTTTSRTTPRTATNTPTTSRTTTTTTPRTTTTTTPRVRSFSISTTNFPPTRSSRGRPLITRSPEVTVASLLGKQTLSSRKATKVVRSTTQLPSVTSSLRETKVEIPVLKSTVNLTARGSLYNRKKQLQEERSNSKEKLAKDVEDSILFSTKIPKPSFKKSSRPVSKYRSDISQRGAVVRSTTTPPVYVPTIPSAPYVPTVPTVTPPSRGSTVYTVPGTVLDGDLGLEVISFDDSVNNKIPSANLVNGEYLSSSENSLLPLVKDGTTEKPVSIIERIINSITAINSTTAQERSKSAATLSTTESSSAILKLATKKFKSDKTKTDSTSQTLPIGTVSFTTEKPTTIIEKILSSLSAIQATDDTNSNQVGKDFNTISASSTTPIPMVIKSTTSRSTLPAQISTSINPLSVLDEITPDQALEKRTIGRLLDILNGLLSTTESSKNVVVVTPKTSSFVTQANENTISSSGFSFPFSTTTVSPTFADENSVFNNRLNPFPLSLSTIPETITELFTSSSKDISSTTTSRTENIPTSTDSDLFSTTTNIPTITVEPQTFATFPQPTTLFNPDIKFRSGTTETTYIPQTSTPFSITIEPQIATTNTPTTTIESTTLKSDTPSANANILSSSTTESTTTTTFPSLAEVGLDSTTNTVSLYTLLSTLPSLQKFEVSPGSVSVFSANDISNAITSDDLLNTVTISSRFNFDNTATTQSSTTTDASVTTFEPTTTSSTEDFTEGATTLTAPQFSTITVQSGGFLHRGAPKSVASNNKSNKTNNSTSFAVPNREGKLLNFAPDPVQNSIDVSTPSTTTSTTPDYFIFAVLNNNTVLRKRPSTIPNKDTPFVIVGLYPNNTIVRKFPNGTLVPMEQIIRVRGFDTRENPPPLPEITSNQVTNDPGSSQSNVQTVEQNTVPILQPNPLSLEGFSSTSTTPGVGNFVPSTPKTQPISTSTTPSTVSSTSSTTVPSTTIKFVTSTLPSSTTLVTSSTENIPIVSTTPFGTVKPNTVTTLGSGITQTSTSTLPTLSEFLNGRTIEAFNTIVNKSSTNTNTERNYQTLQVNQVDITTVQNLNTATTTSTTTTTSKTLTTTESPTSTRAPTTTIVAKPIPLLNRFAEDSTTTGRVFTVKAIPSITIPTTTTEIPTTTVYTTTNIPRRGGMKFSDYSVTTTDGTIRKTTQTPITSTYSPFRTSTFLPTFFSTLFPTIFSNEPVTRELSTTVPYTTKFYEPSNEIIAVSATTQQASTVPSTRTRQIRTTTLPPTTIYTPPTTTTSSTTIRTTTTTEPTTTTSTVIPITASTSKRSITVTDLNTVATPTTTPKLKQLTDQQKKDLEAIAALEKEQAMLLRQLSFLTSLGLGGGAASGINIPKPQNSNNDLANRVIQLAMERDKEKKKTTTAPKTTTERSKPTTRKTKRTTTTTERAPTSIQDQLAKIEATRQPQPGSPSLDQILKQYDLSDVKIETTTRPGITLGKSTDAVLAALLKEQGLAPSTPKSLESVFEAATRKARPRATTQRPPGRLMQGLNWLLNVLAPTPPTTTRKPRSKPKKPRKPPVDQELLTNSPTHITPVVTSGPSVVNSLSQGDIQKLIKQLEGIQKDPTKGSLDLTQIKSLQNLINSDEGVQVSANGEHGTTSRKSTTRRPKTETTEKRKSRRLTTEAPLAISNSVDPTDEELDEFPSTTAKVKAPFGFRPVPGVDDNTSDPFISGNLITAAVNVTRAISGFLGSALQEAAARFSNMYANGSQSVTNIFGGSSSISSLAAASSSSNPSG